MNCLLFGVRKGPLKNRVFFKTSCFDLRFIKTNTVFSCEKYHKRFRVKSHQDYPIWKRTYNSPKLAQNHSHLAKTGLHLTKTNPIRTKTRLTAYNWPGLNVLINRVNEQKTALIFPNGSITRLNSHKLAKWTYASPKQLLRLTIATYL